MPEASAPAVAQPFAFAAYWLAETLRLRESLWGPLEDAREVRRARSAPGSFEEKILLRGQQLGKREGLDASIRSWAAAARLMLILLCGAAILAGAGAAVGALGDGGRQVNILLALTALLGLNMLTLFFWLASFLVKGAGGAWLGESWLWLTRKLARGPDAALVPRALVEILGRTHSLRSVLGSVSNALWAIALCAMLLAMLALLSARRYSFNWETTLLAPDVFVSVTQVLGWLPAQLGFSIPDEAIVRASGSLQALPEPAQALWSSWLLGCVVVYGLLPRVIALFVCLAAARRRLGVMRLDTGLPGYAELRDRLTPVSEHAGVDAPAPAPQPSRMALQASTGKALDRPVLVGIELPPDLAWPPGALSPEVADLGIVDGRAERNALLDRLQGHAPARLLLVCDGHQTPDRGTTAWLADLAGFAGDTHVALLDRRNGPQGREAAWLAQLQAAGFPPLTIHTEVAAALDWLAGHIAPDGGAGGSHARS